MCRHYWKNEEVPYTDRLAGRGRCKQTACGGPMASRTFPSYLGPLPEGDWSLFCFVCGTPEVSHGVKVAGEEATRVLGVCSDHAKLVGSMAPVGEDLTVEKPVLLLPKAGTSAADQAVRGV